MSKLIGIHGKAGAGKDTLAKGLRVIHGYARMAFADPLRHAASATFGVPLEYFIDPDLKGITVPYWQMSPREMMQRMGTEAVRNTFGQDVWVRRWYQDYAHLPDGANVVVTDVREESEALRIRELGGVVVHLQRDGAGLTGTAGQHSSEAGIQFQEGDYRYYNNETVEKLWASLPFLLESIPNLKD